MKQAPRYAVSCTPLLPRLS